MSADQNVWKRAATQPVRSYDPQFDTMIYAASIWVIPLIIAITFHEAAHGYGRGVCSIDHRHGPARRSADF
jgi:hypothetical protein